MTTTILPYLNFDGQTEEAMKFYTNAFGGVLEIMRFGDSSMAVTPEEKNRVMHAVLKADAISLMASDCPLGISIKPGDSVHLSLNFTEQAEQDRVWGHLSVGGKITMPLGEQFFGRFGMLTDKFGTHWMLHFNGGEPQ